MVGSRLTRDAYRVQRILHNENAAADRYVDGDIFRRPAYDVTFPC